MSKFYQTMLRAVREAKPDGQLMVIPIDIERNPELRSALSPSLHAPFEFESLMLNSGLEPQTFAETDGLHLLKSRRLAMNAPLAAKRVQTNIDQNETVDTFYHQADTVGELFSHQVSWAHFAQLSTELQKQTQFGKGSAEILRLQQLTPAGTWNRIRFLESLKHQDSMMMFDGGWMIPLGQEQEIEGLINVFRSLPRSKFRDIQLSEAFRPFESASPPVTIRQLSDELNTHVYAINTSPWPVTVRLNSSEAKLFRLQVIPGSAGSISTAALQSDDHGKIEWKLPPYSLWAARCSDNSVRFNEYEFELPDAAADRLRRKIYSLRTKLAEAQKAAPIPVIENPDFELFGHASLNNWDFGQQATAKIRLDVQQAHQGRVSLRMSNQETQPVWIRSNTIPVPETGRLSISAWVRMGEDGQQPPLRLAIEGQVGELNYYRFGAIGSLSPNPQANQLTSQWQRFAVHFDDLPPNVTNLRVGFDLMGQGSVNIDQVEVYDRWLDENDAKAITQRIASCNPLLANQQTFESCRQLLNGYWLRFLDENFATPGTEPSTNEQRSEAVPGAVSPTANLRDNRESQNIVQEIGSGSGDQNGQSNSVGDRTADGRQKSIFRRFRKPRKSNR